MTRLLLMAVTGAALAAVVIATTVSLAETTSPVWPAVVGAVCLFFTVLLSGRVFISRIHGVLEGRSSDTDRGIESDVASALKKREALAETSVRNEVLARKLAEDRADEARRVLSSLDDPVIVFDDFNEVVDANDAAGRMSDVDLADKPSLQRFIGDSDLAGQIEESANGIQPGEVRRIEHESSEDGDDERAQAWEVATRRLAPGDRWVTVLHDVTRDREVARLKSEFVAKASHELRTPLSSIHAYVEMLVDGEVEDVGQQAEFLRIVHEESARMSRLVENMLDISRIEAGVAKAERGAVDLGRVAARVVEAIRPKAAERSIDLVIRSESDGLVVDGDEDMLAEVVENLVGNAVKYTPEHGRVAVSIDPDDLTASVVTTVTDTGLGIPPDDIDRLFEKFYRIGRYERTARGTGLGLNLCRNIVEKVHQGRIGVDSTLGMGSRFWFSVPVRYSGSTAA